MSLQPPNGQDRSLDRALDLSMPVLDEPADLSPAVASLIGDVSRRPQGRVRWIDRRIVIGVVAGFIVGGTSVAAASTVSPWDPYDADPTFSIVYTLPSGATCLNTYDSVATGDLSNPDRPADDSNLDPGFGQWLRSTDLLALADLDAAREDFQDGTAETFKASVDDDGLTSSVPATQLTEDQMYALVIDHAIATVISDEASRRGSTGLAYGGHHQCTGGAG